MAKLTGIILIGRPGAGKSTIGSILAEKYNLKYISSGDIARELAKNDKVTKDNLASGKLADECLMRETLKLRLDEMIDNGQAFILDGFPRFQDQADWLKLNLVGHHFLYVHVDTPEMTCVERLHGRERADDTMQIIQQRMEYFNQFTSNIIDKLPMKIVISGEYRSIQSPIFALLFGNRVGGTDKC